MKKLIAFLLSVVFLSSCSGLVLYNLHFIFKQQLYQGPFSPPFTLIPLLLITVVLVLYLLIFDLRHKTKPINLFVRGTVCFMLDIVIVILITLPLVGFDLMGYLWHLSGVGVFCFFIPYTYEKIKQLLFNW